LIESFIFVLFSPFQLCRDGEYSSNTTPFLVLLKLILYVTKTRCYIIELQSEELILDI
jgi:hypothetical protein